MASILTTTTLVRNRLGFDTTLLSDVNLQAIIDQTEAFVNQRFDVRFVPTTELYIFTGDSTNRVVLPKNPVLRVKSVTVNTTSVTPAYTFLSNNSGVLTMKKTAERYTFSDSDRGNNSVLYDYGLLEVDTSVAPLPITDAETAGSSVVIAMASTTGLTNGDYVRIAGTDGYSEVATISALSANVSITVNSLSYPHAAASLVWRVQSPAVVKQYACVVACLASVAFAVGASFDDIKSYSLEGLSVQKGEPYTQFQETWRQLQREKEDLEMVIRNRPTVA